MKISPKSPMLPSGLVNAIISITFGQHYHNLVLQPNTLNKWDARLVFLQVLRMFRSCAIRFLKPLWGGDFRLDSAGALQCAGYVLYSPPI
jgi:hypothetical protein